MSAGQRAAVVTGAASGMGKETALQLARDGHKVLAVDINADGLRDAAEAGAETLVADLAEPDGRAKVVEWAARERPHGLVNAAAILAPRPIAEVTPESFRRVFQVNLESAWFLCRDVGEHMADGGSIVNFSSPSARWPYTVEAAVYSATKTAIQAATRTFSIVHAPRGIRVNAISPGITDTPMQEQVLRDISEMRGVSYEEMSANRLNLVPLRRSAPPGEIAGVICWLLSDAAAYITGQTIYVDGGYIMSA